MLRLSVASRGAPPEPCPAAPAPRGPSRRFLLPRPAPLARGLRSLPAVLLLALAALLAAPAPAQADVLVSNIGQVPSETLGVHSTQAIAQDFTTGSAAATLASIEFRMYAASGATGAPTVTVRRDSATGTEVAVLDGPTSIPASTTIVTFTAPAGTTLDASTTYFVVLAYDGAGRFEVWYLDLAAEDSGGTSGWSISNLSLYSPNGAPFSAVGGPLMIRVNSPITNNAATGAPTITGTAQVGQELTAAAGDIADDDGLAGAVYAWAWYRKDADGSNRVFIDGATTDSYTVVDADLGKKIEVEASFFDDLDNEETRTSEATDAVIASSAPGAPQHLRAIEDDVRFRLVWDAPSNTGAGPITGYQYRYSAGATVTGAADWVDVAGEGLRRGVTVESLDNSTRYAFEVRAVNSVGAGDAAVTTVTTASPTPVMRAGYPPGESGNTTIFLIWNRIAKLGSEPVTGYEVHVSADAGQSWEVLAGSVLQGDSPSRRLIRFNRQRNESRHYRVRALSATKQSEWSRPVVGATRRHPPAQLVATLTPVARPEGAPQVSPHAGAPHVPAHKDYLLSWPRSATGLGTLLYAVQLSAVQTPWVVDVTIRGDGHLYTRVSGPDALLRTIQVRAVLVATALDQNGEKVKDEIPGTWSAQAGVADGTIDAPTAFNPFSGLLLRAPSRHDGVNAFSFELRFSEEPAPLSYRTVRDHLLETSGATVTRARRMVAGSDQRWEVTVQPAGAGDIRIRLPAGTQECADAATVCTPEGETLTEAVSQLVRGVTLSAALVDVPGEHDAATPFTVGLRFSEEPPSMSYRTVRDALFDVSGATITHARRNAWKRNLAWTLTVAPAGFDTVRLTMRETASCAAAHAICTGRGAKLAGTARATIPGPAAFSVADAEVDEAEGATLDFAVTLNRALEEATIVHYATADGTATAGEDYTAAAAALIFHPGQTRRVVAVTVHDDAHDEGNETLTLTLSNPVGARIDDASATGTIKNTDAMPKAWLGRFGRTVAEQVLEAVEGRLAASRALGVEVTVAGARMGGSGAREEAAARAKLAALTDWLQDEAREQDDPRRRSRAVTQRELLSGSSFALTGEDGGGNGVASLWGRGAVTRFDGRAETGNGDLTLDGEVASGMLGADGTRGPWTVGLLLSHFRGSGSYRGASSGKVESVLTGAFPYGRYAVNRRLSVWGAAGYGAGWLTLTPEGQKPIGTDVDLMMGAVGLRGVALEAPAEGGVELALKSDALAVRTRSKAVRGGGAEGGNLAAATADVTRLRLGLEGTWRGLTLGGGTLAPRLEVGVRHDGGDAETGFGVDAGGGLAWSDPKHGLSAELRARGLLTYESRGFRDRGVSGALTWEPGRGTGSPGRGPKLTLTQTVGGSASGGADALLSRGTLAGLAANDDGADDLRRRRLEIDFDYGFSAFGDRFTWTPQIGVGLSDAGRDYRLGWRLTRDVRDGGSLELSLDATRRESVTDNDTPEHGVGFRLTARW